MQQEQARAAPGFKPGFEKVDVQSIDVGDAAASQARRERRAPLAIARIDGDPISGARLLGEPGVSPSARHDGPEGLRK